MNTLLLASLNVAAWGLVFYAVTEQVGAVRYRRKALEIQDAQLDADLATWARLAGKVRSEQAGNRNGAVLAGSGAQDEQARQSESGNAVVEISHPTIVQNGADV